MHKVYFISIFLFLACSNQTSSDINNESINRPSDSALLNTDLDFEKSVNDSTQQNDLESEILLDENQMAVAYVLICDTSYLYKDLLDQIVASSLKYKIKIDSLGRFYNQQSNKIQLPENDEDEIYAGEYYPRRDFAFFLSIEYASQYLDAANDSLLASVAGIYSELKDAEKQLAKIKATNKSAFISKSSLFMGCLH